MNQQSSKPTLNPKEAAQVETNTLDCDQILTHAGGDPELLIQLCGSFLCELPIHMNALSCALKAGNHPGTERALQRLRNCLIVFGSGNISYTAETLESALRTGRNREVQREWKRLQREIGALVPQVQRLLLEMATPRTAVQ